MISTIHRAVPAAVLFLAAFAAVAQSPVTPGTESRAGAGGSTSAGAESRAPQASRASETRPAESRPTASDPEALALFRKAAREQTPGDPRFELKDLQVDLVATLYERGQDGRRRARTADVTEFWRAASPTATERYRRDLFEPQERKRTVHGFDGAVYWEKLGDAPARELRGADDQDTKKQLQSELARLNDLASSLLLRRLDLPEAVFVFADGPATLKVNGRETPVKALRRFLPGRPPETLYFSEKSFGETDVRTVLSGFAREKTAKRPAELMTFGVHVETGRGASRLVAPLVVETFEDGELVLEGKVREAAQLKINVGLEDVLFAPALR
jgi:hypothetical protein